MAYMSDWEASSVERTMHMTHSKIPAPGTRWTLDAGLPQRSLVLVTGSDGGSVTYDCLGPSDRVGVGFRISLSAWANRDPQPVEPPASVGRTGSQVGGDHYERMGVQPWDVIEASPWLDYWTGTALKYVMRAGQGLAPKVEDLRKAAHFIAKAIELEEKA